MTLYRTIVADPPWDVKRGPVWGSKGEATRDLPYPTMTLEAIATLPIGDLAARDAHLYVWTINAYVDATYELVRGWGFQPSTLLTWCKRPKGIGIGGAYTITTEHVLFARRGSLKPLQRLDSTWWQWKRQTGPHSQKPDAIMDMVEQVSPGPYLEMFSRRARLGWQTWGDESLHGTEAVAMNDLTGMAAQLAEALTDTLDTETISYLALLDALASAGVTLTPDIDGEASRAYAIAVEIEGAWERS